MADARQSHDWSGWSCIIAASLNPHRGRGQPAIKPDSVNLYLLSKSRREEEFEEVSVSEMASLFGVEKHE